MFNLTPEANTTIMTNARQSHKRHNHRKKPHTIPLEPHIVLAYEFYNEYKVNYLLDNDLIRALMRQVLNKRKEIVATEADVDRALNVLDTNHDNKINFDQFIKFMQLFFATKLTLAERLERVINYIIGTEHTKAGHYLKPSEISDINDFIQNFYGKKIISGSINKYSSSSKVEFSQYVRDLETEFRGCTFVQFNAVA